MYIYMYCILEKLYFFLKLIIITMGASIPLNISITDFLVKNPDERWYRWCMAADNHDDIFDSN